MPRLTVRVTPNASKTEIVGRELGILKIRIAAAPTDGRANDALIRLLAEEYDCAPNEIRIVKGAVSRTKIVELRDGQRRLDKTRVGATHRVAHRREMTHRVAHRKTVAHR